MRHGCHIPHRPGSEEHDCPEDRPRPPAGRRPDGRDRRRSGLRRPPRALAQRVGRVPAGPRAHPLVPQLVRGGLRERVRAPGDPRRRRGGRGARPAHQRLRQDPAAAHRSDGRQGRGGRRRADRVGPYAALQGGAVRHGPGRRAAVQRSGGAPRQGLRTAHRHLLLRASHRPGHVPQRRHVRVLQGPRGPPARPGRGRVHRRAAELLLVPPRRRRREGHPPGGSGKAVVAFGDSLTDGFGATPGADRRYPDELAKRLAAEGRSRPVLNAGIGGNKVLNDSQCFGESALDRFRRDALGRPDVGTVILLEGTNDIVMPDSPPPTTAPSPAPGSPPRRSSPATCSSSARPTPVA
ncbi:GDSL-type esterase/lipase family protein [Streptomyces sp. MS1.HAVA.3]|uniref:GDSL-type esterase/lipase family protein n=1 Tax=Streptomyces caledonius TaxID=3134107 RepID=A0ABU8UDA0_9ACTN